ncbi:MAG: thioredoxin 1 [Clostridia bacterium]|nr:thioredoxin 1 [Clostridia bacterium]
MVGTAIVTVTDANFKEEVLQASTPVLVDFWAAWCGPCRMIAPVVEELAKEFNGRLKVCKLNVDENSKTPTELGIMSIPTLILFKGGVAVNRVVGYHTKEQLMKILQNDLEA